MIEPLQRGRTTGLEPEKVDPVDPAVVEATLPHLPPVVRDLVRLQSLIGCRPGEICDIRPGMVNRQDDVWTIELDRHKTAHRGKQRVLFVGPRAQEILAPDLLRDDNEACFSPVDSERKRLEERHATGKTPLGYGNRPGTNRKRHPNRKPRESYDSGSYRRAVQLACDKAFPPPDGMIVGQVEQWQSKYHWSPNQLRHTFGTNVRRQEGLEVARLLLGHADASTTAIYAEMDRNKAIEAAKRVG